MDVVQWLRDNAARLVDDTSATIARAHLRHYDSAGAQATRGRIAEMHAKLVECLATRQLQPIVDHARVIAAKRFAAGYDLFEVQVVLNALEETIWKHLFETIPTGEVVEPLGLVTTVLSSGKDALARAYVTLAT